MESRRYFGKGRRMVRRIEKQGISSNENGDVEGVRRNEEKTSDWKR